MSLAVSTNQKKGIVLLLMTLFILGTPVMIFGIPVPFDLYFPIAIFAMILMILGMCLLMKVIE